MPISKNQYRIFELSKKYNLGHLGSNITCLPIIEAIYKDKREDDIFILGEGHASLSLYVVLEEKYGFDAEKLLQDFGTHCRRDIKRKIFCSTGSLGLPETIAVGFALSNRDRKVYLLSSDGGLYEGACFEALTAKRDFKLTNLAWYCNFNGFSAYQETDRPYFIQIYGQHVYLMNTSNVFWDFPFLEGLDAHYRTLTEDDWQWIQTEYHNA